MTFTRSIPEGTRMKLDHIAINASNSQIGGTFFWGNQTENPVGAIIFENVIASKFKDVPNSWPSSPPIRIDGFKYESMVTTSTKQEAQKIIPRPDMIVFAAFQFDPEAAKDIHNAYSTGRGGIVTRGEAEIIEKKNGSFQIIISSIPFYTTSFYFEVVSSYSSTVSIIEYIEVR